jgi:hypothetical protein
MTGIEAMKHELTSEIVGGKTHWFGRHQTGHQKQRTTVHLLPNYDEYLIAYRDRSGFFDPSRLVDDAKFLSGVLSRHIVVFDGQVVGGWHSTTTSDGVNLEGTLLVQPTKREQSALSAAAKNYSRYLERPVISRLTANS